MRYQTFSIASISEEIRHQPKSVLYSVWKLNGSSVHTETWTDKHLNNYFDFHVCLSIRGSVVLVPSPQKLTSIPASVSQNVINKSCLLCVKSEKYAS